jgi:hypothetical protein
MMKLKTTYLLSALLFLTAITITAQVKHSHQFKHVFDIAEKNYDYGYYKDALTNYMKIYREDSNDIQLNYKIAMCHYYEKHSPDSIIHFLLHDDASDISDVQLLLGKLFHLKHNFSEAEKHFMCYKKFPLEKRSVSDADVDRLIEMTHRAEEAMKYPRNGKIVNLGKNINSPFHEYVPIITSGDSLMFFTSRRPGSTGGAQDVLGNYFEDIYVSRKVNSQWGAPVNIGPPVNTKDHDACVALAPDGMHMLLYRPEKNKTGGDLYETRFQNNAWSAPVKLDDHINSKGGTETSACISMDGEFLFYSSDKFGGFGGKDIYRCKRLPNGKWGLPVNLGEEINTSFDEDAPFLSSDDRFLYFSSKGHTTIGGFDVFKSEYNEDNFSWSFPRNLGYPINSVSDDVFFVISADGYQGYYSSEKDDGFGGEDIYLVDMHYDESDVRVRHVYVFEKGASIPKPIKAKVTLHEEGNKQLAGYYISNQMSGKMIILVSPYKTYSATVEAEGYTPATVSVEQLTPENEDAAIKVELQPRKK